MSHLRIVGAPEPPKPRKRRKYARHCSDVLNAEEQTRARQALRNMRDAFGTLACMAAAMVLPVATLQRATRGTAQVSPAVLVRASKASGLSIAELLGAPVLAGTCRACGQIRRAS